MTGSKETTNFDVCRKCHHSSRKLEKIGDIEFISKKADKNLSQVGIIVNKSESNSTNELVFQSITEKIVSGHDTNNMISVVNHNHVP